MRHKGMHKRMKIWLGVLCWILFGILLFNVLHKTSIIYSIDSVGFCLVKPVLQLKPNLLTELTFLGDPVTVGILTIGLMLLLWRHRRIADSVWYGMLQFIGYCLLILLKYSVIRPRPTGRLVAVGGYSFPSGHTFSTIILIFTLLAILVPKCKKQSQKILVILCGIFWITIIMYSRVYLHAHYLTDVIGAFLLACGWWLLANSQRKTFFNWLQKPIKK